MLEHGIRQGVPPSRPAFLRTSLKWGYLIPAQAFQTAGGLSLDPALLMAQVNVSFVQGEVSCPGN